MKFPTTLREARERLADGALVPDELAEAALARANSNAGLNTYLWRDPDWTRLQEETL